MLKENLEQVIAMEQAPLIQRIFMLPVRNIKNSRVKYMKTISRTRAEWACFLNGTFLIELTLAKT